MKTHIHYASVPCPIGWLLLAATGKGICSLKLGDNPAELEQLLHNEFVAAYLERDEVALHKWIAPVLDYLGECCPLPELPLDVRATPFQWQVWQALQRIPCGETRTYGQVAAAIGRPSAVRAVARACAANPVALLVPCHRVVRQDGDIGGYRWGIQRKAALLRLESEALKHP